jgi:menaquinone-dependent protoporphyrinogen oxidase
MAILVTYASRHGSTHSIADYLAQQLRQQGKEVDLCPVETIKATEDLTPYEAVVLGSAIYFGAWRKEAVEFVRRHQQILAELPVWLFSVGPLGPEMNTAQELPKDVVEFQQTIHPRGYRTFAGVLDPQVLSFPERLVTKAIHAPIGDFRDWKSVEKWAESIAHDLTLTEAKP